ncbi:hypothetical protein ACS5PN_26790 [Roseateles sp. NT4]|uniref:hypothetical protein n=1 Tax=Roseateles sp. NT4 TaxID=3453715 RepID=UPI003EEC9C05
MINAATDTGVATAAGQAVATSLITPASAQRLHDTRMFSALVHGPSSVNQTQDSGLRHLDRSFFKQIAGEDSFGQIQSRMLQAFDPSDPIKTSYAMMSSGIEAQRFFTTLHVSTSLASAAVSMLGGLLKNQG